jgi:hypothetical protein
VILHYIFLQAGANTEDNAMKKMFFLILVLLVLSSCSSKKEAASENDATGNDADSESTDISQNDSSENVPDETNEPDEKNEPDKDVLEENDDQPHDDDVIIIPCEDVWADDTSGLMWENCPKLFQGNWSGAINYCNNLVHGGFDDWRLPTLSELRSLVRGCPDAVTGGACNATDECLNEENCMNHPCSVPSCDYKGGPANGCYRDPSVVGECDYHWSSKESATYDDSAWYIDFMNGVINPTEKSWKELYGRCVRDAETEENDDDEISDDEVSDEDF